MGAAGFFHIRKMHILGERKIQGSLNMYISMQYISLKPSKFSGCMCFCLELRHSVQRKKQMRTILSSLTWHQNYCKSSQKHQAAKSALFRRPLAKAIWMGRRKVKLKELEHLGKLQKVFSLLLYMHIVTAVHDFAFPDNISVLENRMKADYLVLSACILMCTLCFC